MYTAASHSKRDTDVGHNPAGERAHRAAIQHVDILMTPQMRTPFCLDYNCRQRRQPIFGAAGVSDSHTTNHHNITLCLSTPVLSRQGFRCDKFFFSLHFFSFFSSCRKVRRRLYAKDFFKGRISSIVGGQKRGGTYIPTLHKNTSLTKIPCILH